MSVTTTSRTRRWVALAGLAAGDYGRECDGGRRQGPTEELAERRARFRSIPDKTSESGGSITFAIVF